MTLYIWNSQCAVKVLRSLSLARCLVTRKVALIIPTGDSAIRKHAVFWGSQTGNYWRQVRLDECSIDTVWKNDGKEGSDVDR